MAQLVAHEALVGEDSGGLGTEGQDEVRKLLGEQRHRPFETQPPDAVRQVSDATIDGRRLRLALV